MDTSPISQIDFISLGNVKDIVKNMNAKKDPSFEIYQETSRRAITKFHDFLKTVKLSPDYFDTDYTTREQQATFNSFTEEQKIKFNKLYIPYLAYKLYSEDKDIGMREGREETLSSKGEKGGKSKRRTKKRYSRRKRSSTITRYPG